MPGFQGFMPQPGPGTIYGGDWSQNYGDVMDTLLQAQQAGQQNAWNHTPFADSFNRRFGGMLPPSLAGVQQPVQQQADPQTLAALQGALAGAIQNSEAFSLPNGTVQHSGSMQSQPWYDEYLAAHSAGAPTPMLQNMGGRGLNETEQAGIDARRAERLGGLTPMAERRQNVQNKALYAREQNAVDSGNMSPNQQYFNELARLQGDLGGQGGGDKIVDLFLGGPQFAADNYRTDAILAGQQSNQQIAMDPRMQWLQHVTNGGTMTFPQFMRQIGAQQQPGPQAGLAPVLSPQEAVAASEKANSLGYGDISRTLDSLQTTMPNAQPQEMLEALARAGITRQNLQGYVEDKPSMPYGFSPGPISFLPWLIAGENEQEYKQRLAREAYANGLLGMMGK